jgi:hypothetical protein
MSVAMQRQQVGPTGSIEPNHAMLSFAIVAQFGSEELATTNSVAMLLQVVVWFPKVVAMLQPIESRRHACQWPIASDCLLGQHFRHEALQSLVPNSYCLH